MWSLNDKSSLVEIALAGLKTKPETRDIAVGVLNAAFTAELPSPHVASLDDELRLTFDYEKVHFDIGGNDPRYPNANLILILTNISQGKLDFYYCVATSSPDAIRAAVQSAKKWITKEMFELPDGFVLDKT